MKKIAIAFILFMFFTARLFAQSSSTSIGSRAAGMGYTSATLSDAWALFNNPGGLANKAEASVAAAQEIHPAAEGMGRAALVMSGALGGGVAAGGFFRFGDAFYNEQVVAAGYGNHVGIASLGARASYIQYHVDGSQNRSALALGFGGIAKLTPVLSVGAYIDNINQPVISKNDHEQLPVRMSAALGFQLAEKFLFAAEIQKDLEYQPVFKTGIELSVHRQLTTRIGFNLHPNTVFAGIGFTSRKMKIDYSAQLNTLLGAVHQMSFIYTHTRNKKSK